MLGNASRDLSRYEKSIAYYEQALKIARELKNRDSEGLALWGIGMATIIWADPRKRFQTGAITGHFS